MRPFPYYEENGIATVVSLRTEKDDIIVEYVYPDEHTGELSKKCCLDFEPQIGDKVERCFDVDEEIDGWILRKVTEMSDIRKELSDAIKTNNFDFVAQLFLSSSGVDNLKMRKSLAMLMDNIFISGKNSGMQYALDLMKKAQ